MSTGRAAEKRGEARRAAFVMGAGKHPDRPEKPRMCDLRAYAGHPDEGLPDYPT